MDIGHVQRIVSAGRFSDDGEPGILLDNAPETIPKEWMVVDE
jgi:hypothetical protein